MFTIAACVLGYGIGGGIAIAVSNAMFGDLDGLEVMVGGFWPVVLPGMIALWVTQVFIKAMTEEE